MKLNRTSTSGSTYKASSSTLLIPSGNEDNDNQRQQHQQHAQRRIPLRDSGKKVQQPNRKANIALVVILVGLSLAILLHASHVMAQQMKRLDHEDHADHIMSQHEPQDHAVAPLQLPLERIFTKTVQSCLPVLSSKCQTYIPVDDIPRIAILAPPGDFGDWVFRWASKVVDTRLGSNVKGVDLQLVSHVPPYGYGKTHGWTKIVRVLPRSLMLGAADAIRGSLQLGQTQDELTMADLKAALRQLTRYHCRVSHLAAHTAVLTLEMDILAHSPYIASEGLLNFLNITALHQGEVEDEDMERKEDSDDRGSFFTRAEDVIAMSSNVQSYASSLLTYVERHEQVNLITELNSVLQEELNKSRNFTNWPCESFWTTGEGQDGTQLSSFGKRLAKSLSPNCKGAHTQCIRKEDRCEEAGDAHCTKSK